MSAIEGPRVLLDTKTQLAAKAIAHAREIEARHERKYLEKSQSEIARRWRWLQREIAESRQ